MNKAVKKQTGKLMLYNFLAFGLIFAVFALLIYFQISSSLFNPVREDIATAQNFVKHDDDFISWQTNFLKDLGGKGSAPEEPGGPNKPPHVEPNALPFRVNVIVRGRSGDVLNQHAIGRFSWDNNIEEIPAQNDTDVFETIITDHGSLYESYTLIKTEDSNDYYVQLIANVDGEKNVLDSIANYLLAGSIICVFLAIFVSYKLTQFSMKPIVNSWNRQTEFVENASHELRTPLTIIQNKLENLFTSPYDTIIDHSESIAIVLGETTRLSKLTTDLMTLARSDSGETLLTKEVFTADDLIKNVCEPYREIAQLDDKTLTVDLSYNDSLNADKLRFHEVLVILLDNALKYTRVGDRIVVKTAKKQGRLILRVEDTGIGLSEVNYEKVFQRFYREDTARGFENKSSSGLGLAIARWVVTQHGGSIKIFREDSKTVVEVII